MNKKIKRLIALPFIFFASLSMSNCFAGGMANTLTTMLDSINANPKWQAAVLQTFNTTLAGKCSPLIVTLMVDDAKGLLDSDASKSAGILAAALAYYRQYNLSRGMSSAHYDSLMKPYYDQARRDGFEVSTQVVKECIAANQRFMTLATSK
jgi:hypothetical protein